MRIILYTGKGGVGKTSIAAATALMSARQGLKTLVVSTDAAHSLGDSFDIKLAAEPLEIEKNLWAQEIDAVHEVEKGWGKVQEYLTALFSAKAIMDITTEELTVFPGMEELLSLLRIFGYYKERTFEVIVIDCAPTGETFALLSFPEIFRWWMDKLFPLQRKAVKLVKPIVEPLLGMPLPQDSVFDEIEKLYNQLAEMREILSARDTTSIRIVVNPEKMVIKEAQRSFTYMNLYDFNVDSIVVNRVIPDGVTDEYFKTWKDIQQKYREMITESFSPLPILYAPLFEKEIVGSVMLQRLADAVFKEQEAVAIMHNRRVQQVEKDGEEYVFSISMPFTEKKELNLNQKGDELIIKVGNVKRNIIIPRVLLRHTIKSAKFEAETLKIRFGGSEHV